MSDSYTSMHIFNVPHETVVAALMSYLDVEYLNHQMAMLRNGKPLTQEEDRKMFHYLFRKQGKHDVFLGDTHSSVYMDIGPCPDIENYARDISELVGGTVLFYSTFENDPVECGVCHNGETVTMLVRGNGRDHELTHKEMSMRKFYSAIGKDSVQPKSNYNKIDKEDLPSVVERDCGISLQGTELYKHNRSTDSLAQIYDEENLVIYDLSIRSEEERKESIVKNKVPAGDAEEAFVDTLLSAIAVGFLSILEKGAEFPKFPPRGTVLLRDLVNLYVGKEADSSMPCEVLITLLQNNADSWSDEWIRKKKTQILDRF